MGQGNQSFVNGVPELLILRLLSGKEMYGYELVREITSTTGHTLSFGEGCVYPILHSLEKNGHLSSKRLKIGGRERFYYRLTPQGHRRFEKMSAEWQKISKGVAIALGGVHGQPAAA